MLSLLVKILEIILLILQIRNYKKSNRADYTVVIIEIYIWMITRLLGHATIIFYKNKNINQIEKQNLYCIIKLAWLICMGRSLLEQVCSERRR